MDKKMKFSRLKKSMHPDYVGKYGILIYRNGKTIIVDENSITTEELDRLSK